MSAGFTPRMLARVEDAVARMASEIVDEVAGRGEVDFVTEVAAALPLRIICDMMAMPQSEFGYVFDRTNIILGAADPEYVPEATDILTALLQAGGDLAQLMTSVAERQQGGAGDDLTTTLMNAEVDGDRLSPADLASFFILLVVAGNETTRNAISWGLKLLTDHPGPAGPLAGRRRRGGPHRGGGDRAPGQPGHLHAPHRHPRRRGRRGARFGPATSCASSTWPPTGTRTCSPTPSASTSPASPTPTSASAAPGRTSASAPTWPAGRSP